MRGRLFLCLQDLHPVLYEISALLCSKIGSDLLGQSGHDLIEVAYDTDIGHVKDGSVLILVDGDDQIGLFHTGHVLDGSGDTDCEVKLRTNCLTCLTNLKILWLPAIIYNGTGTSNLSTKCLSKILKDSKVLCRTYSSTTSNKYISLLDINCMINSLNYIKNLNIAIIRCESRIELLNLSCSSYNLW